MTDGAARLAEALRAAKKQHGLSGTQIAELIERLTGNRPSLMWVSRRLHGDTELRQMVGQSDPCPHCGEITYSLDPQLLAMSVALGVDPSSILLGNVERITPPAKMAP